MEGSQKGSKGREGRRMFGVSEKVLQMLRREYPAGTKVRVIRLDDPYRDIPKGTLGTVQFVDDAGNIHVSWECGSSLSLIYGEDEWEKL